MFSHLPFAARAGLWLAAALAGLLGSMVASGAETGLYALSRLKLRVRQHRGDRNAGRLSRHLGRASTVLETLLLWQNLSGFILSASITMLLAMAGWGELQQALISTLLVTPLVLLVAEILPKDMFYTYADTLMYRLAPLLSPAIWLLTIIPLLPLVQLFSRLALKLIGSTEIEPAPRSLRQQFDLVVEESTASGVITDTQQDIIQRALLLARLSVRDVMVPWNRVIGVPVRIGRDGFLALVRRYNISRLPVLGATPADVLGVVNVLDVLADRQPFDLRRHIRPATVVQADQTVRAAISQLQREHRRLALVHDRQQRVVGVVTMKDLVEELVGELENW